MAKYIVMLFSILSLMLWSCAQQHETPIQQIDIDGETRAAESVIGQLIESWEARNVELLSVVMAHDPDMVSIGTDAAEFFVGWQPFCDSSEKLFQAYDSIQVSVVEQHTKVHASGSAAWFALVLNWRLESSGEIFELTGARFTGVLENRDGKWVIVQIHGSIPVAGQAVEY